MTLAKQLLTFLASLAIAASASAQERGSFGDWRAGKTTNEKAVFAATVNQSGNVLGVYCYGAEKCIYLLSMRTACEAGSRYPVLVNSDQGSLELQVYCNGQRQSNVYEYVFTNFEKIEDVVLRAHRVGFALPLESDEFNVVRFSLRGSNEAIAELHELTVGQTVPTRRNTRDQRL